MKDKTIYFSGLNGLRAIASISVLVSHVFLYKFADFGLPKIFKLHMGGYGVTLFFVISGFLITYLLLVEQKRTDKIIIQKFYLRRILRIWPIYYLFIGICLVTALFTNELQDIFSNQIYWYLIFSANIPFIFVSGINIIVHYWSIGVEEQFYLFWPWIVKIKRGKILLISIFIFGILFLTKSLTWFYLGKESVFYRTISITRFHCMMIGAIGAILYFENSKLFLKVLNNRFSQAIAWSILLLLGFGFLNIPAPLVQETIAVVSLVMIIGQIKIENRLINLENKMANFLGKISYGIYIIHPLVIFFTARILKHIIFNNVTFKYIAIYTFVISSTIFLAYISYQFIEKPFLKWKRKFAIVESSNLKQRIN